MTRRGIVALLLLFFVCASRAACPESGGIGGTGVTSEGGIGGTGIQPQSDMGVIGVITAFGSICVSNVEIDYDAATPVASAGAPASAASLAIGQVVAVHAIGDAQRARAQRIDILDGAVGPVEAFDAATSVFHIAGQRVHIGAGTVFGGDVTREALAQRPAVRVSGLWRADGMLEASRIERASPDAPAHIGARDWPRVPARVLIVEGYVREAQTDRLNVGGLEFARRAGSRSELRRDDLVRAVGRFEDGRPVLERTDVLRGERSGRSERNEGSGRPDRVERSGGSGRPDRPERVERPDRSGRH